MLVTNKKSIRQYLTKCNTILLNLIKEYPEVEKVIDNGRDIVVRFLPGWGVAWSESYSGTFKPSRFKVNMAGMDSARLSKLNLLQVDMLSHWVDGVSLSILDETKNLFSINSFTYNMDIDPFEVCVNTTEIGTGIWKCTRNYTDLLKLVHGLDIEYAGLYSDFDDIVSFGWAKGNEESLISALGFSVPIHSIILTKYFATGRSFATVYEKKSLAPGEYDLLVV